MPAGLANPDLRSGFSFVRSAAHVPTDYARDAVLHRGVVVPVKGNCHLSHHPLQFPASHEKCNRINGLRAPVDDLPLLPGMLTIAPASLDALWRKVCRRCGVEGLHLHDARAAALTSMARRVDVLTLARISGHRDIKMLMRYFRATPEQIAAML